MPFLTQGNTNWRFILIVVVLAVIAGGGVWFLSGLEQEKSTIPERDPIRGIEEETINWQVYRGEGRTSHEGKNYSYELKYPLDWDYYEIREENLVVFAPKERIVKITHFLDVEDEKILTLMLGAIDKIIYEKDYLTKMEPGEHFDLTTENIKISGLRGLYYTKEYIKDYVEDMTNYEAGDKNIYVSLMTDDVYFFFYLLDYQHVDTFNKILATFKSPATLDTESVKDCGTIQVMEESERDIASHSALVCLGNSIVFNNCKNSKVKIEYDDRVVYYELAGSDISNCRLRIRLAEANKISDEKMKKLANLYTECSLAELISSLGEEAFGEGESGALALTLYFYMDIMMAINPDELSETVGCYGPLLEVAKENPGLFMRIELIGEKREIE